MQLLSNDTIALRPLEPTDLDTLYQWENDTALWVVSDTVAPYSREACGITWRTTRVTSIHTVNCG